MAESNPVYEKKVFEVDLVGTFGVPADLYSRQLCRIYSARLHSDVSSDVARVWKKAEMFLGPGSCPLVNGWM